MCKRLMRKLLEGRVKQIEIERDDCKRERAFYPPGGWYYERLTLAIKFHDLKITVWEAFYEN